MLCGHYGNHEWPRRWCCCCKVGKVEMVYPNRKMARRSYARMSCLHLWEGNKDDRNPRLIWLKADAKRKVKFRKVIEVQAPRETSSPETFFSEKEVGGRWMFTVSDYSLKLHPRIYTPFLSFWLIFKHYKEWRGWVLSEIQPLKSWFLHLFSYRTLDVDATLRNCIFKTICAFLPIPV